MLSTLFAPVFVLIGVLMLFLRSDATAAAGPPQGVYTVLAVCCFVLAFVALVDLYVIRRRKREELRWHRST
ncbi:hypothetical protein ADK90_10385 [Streptomyces sp. XY413]|nr:hypothetical protein ADK90_10385 [Streptomyces sp. XY413]